MSEPRQTHSTAYITHDMLADAVALRLLLGSLTHDAVLVAQGGEIHDPAAATVAIESARVQVYAMGELPAAARQVLAELPHPAQVSLPHYIPPPMALGPLDRLVHVVVTVTG